jgi:hypothetical protein
MNLTSSGVRFSVLGPLPADGGAAPEPGPSFTAIVESAARAAAGLVGDAASWWTVPSTSLLQPAVSGATSTLQPLLLLVLAGSVIIQSIRIVASRRGEQVLAVAGGLLRFAVIAALGVTVLQCALLAGDTLAVTLVGDSSQAFGATMREALTARRDGLAEPFLLLLLSVVVLLLAAAQWMAMALRQVALLAVAATLPLAAAGSLTATTRGWLSRLVPWGLALVLYKPAAALIQAVGQQYLTQIAAGAGSGVTVVLAGIVVLALGVAALPVSLRLLSFTSVRAAGGGNGSEAMVGAVGAVRLTSRSSTSPSVQLATFMENAGPGSTLRPGVRAATGARPGVSGFAAQPGNDVVPVRRGTTAAPPIPEASLLEPALTRSIPRVPADHDHPAHRTSLPGAAR